MNSRARTTWQVALRLAALNFISVLAVSTTAANAEIIWDGNFNERNFLNHHGDSSSNTVYFWWVSDYGRPIQYGGQPASHVGNGDLLSLVSAPTRGGEYAAKFTVKSRAGGGVEPADCDSSTTCENRRSQIQMTKAFLDYYDAIPYRAERWLSFSIYLPEDFDASGSGFGPVIWGSKSSTQNRPGAFGLQIANNSSWELIHRYYSEAMNSNDVSLNNSWWLSVDYTKDYPSSSHWPAGLVDFPDEEESKAALGNLNRGGWTDFIWHFRTDVREFEQNQGFMDVYMRAGSGSWVHVLKIRPMKDLARSESWRTSNPERIYDRGIGQYGPGGYTSSIGLYMDKDRVWDHAKNMTVYIDNYKVGSENATFSMMSHDGSSPGNPGNPDSGEPPESPPPMPPQIIN